MEERLIEEEIGRKIRFRRGVDGKVEIVDDILDGGAGEDGGDYDYIDLGDEDDEELAGLSPEAARELVKKKEEEEEARRKEYERLCDEGNKLLETGSFKAAELKFERAITLDEKATDATVGYWRAKTADFDEADVLIEEYAEEGSENLEYDLGYEAIDAIKAKFKDKLQKRYDEICEEEESLAEKVTTARDRRRGMLKTRRKNTGIAFGMAAVVTIAMLALAIVFGLNNFRVSDARYIAPTIIFVALFLASFVAFGVCTNKFVNACRIHNANERLSSTEDGERVQELRNYKELYEYLLA